VRKLLRLVVTLLLSAVAIPLAHAHRLDLFVTADGAIIQGTATYAPGGPAQRGTVTFQAPDGTELGEVELGSDGSFAFQTPFRCDITVTVDTPDAHRARATIPAAELPQALPAWRPDGEHDDAPQTGDGGMGEEASATAVGDADDLLPLIERAVSRQIAPLRQEIGQMEGAIRMRDILGGLGYIAGLAGLLLYFKTRRSGSA